MLRYIIIAFTLLLWMPETESQNIIDAYRYAFQTPTGSARYNGLSGAMSAIGADLSTASHNPAGIAAFWKSEVAGSLGVSIIGNNSTLIDGGTGEIGSNDFKFTVPQGGIVFTTYTPNKSWMAKSFGISYKQLVDYGNDIFYEGNSRGSISERWAELASGKSPNELDFWEAGPAYDAFVLYDPINNQYHYDYKGHKNELHRSQKIDYEGSQGELTFSFGGNYLNRFLIGGAIGIDFLNFTRKKQYSEVDINNEIPYFMEIVFNENLVTSGVGVNAKIGSIIKLTPQWAWSIAFASPTRFSLNDSQRNIVQNTWKDTEEVETESGDSEQWEFENIFISPWRISTGVAYKVGGRGFIDAEMDYIGYKSSKFDFKNPSIDDQKELNKLNTELNEVFYNTLNFRLGGEMAVSAFRLRAGGFFYSSPLESFKNTKGFSLGAGFRGDNWYIDISYMMRANSRNYLPYLPYESPDLVIPSVDIKTRESNFGLTLGFKM